MSRCTAPVQGHRTASARAACPACGSSYRSYSPRSYPPPVYQPRGRVSRTTGGSGSSGSTSSPRPSWSSASSPVTYTLTEVRSLTPVRHEIEARAHAYPDLRDVFLCHAWDDRRSAAKELHELLEANNVSVWFSEKDVRLGTPLLRAIDKGLAKSRVGIVLVTPAFLTRIAGEGIADKELSELLAREQLIPVVHETTYEALREESPLLASRTGLNTADDSMADIAVKIAELVDV
ncbi:toll/interleukin-1 receptor domain-containing protein [Rhodococcus ruber]|uniref:toll/interleukin-1 receptor domain-containing protein n=1 Tax=Rhodococcus ruber TaxID=1830 RepID=UPI003D8193E5